MKIVLNDTAFIEFTPKVEPTITGICELCGGSTKSLNDHICDNCREQIEMIFRDYRAMDALIDKDTYIGYIEDTIDKDKHNEEEK